MSSTNSDSDVDTVTVMNNIPVFKVYNLTKEDKIESVTVFYGYREGMRQPDYDRLEDLFKSAPDAPEFMDDITGFPFFSEKERSRLATTPVKFVSASLKIDDSIEIIKLKIMNALANQFATEEMSLFCHVKEEYNPISVFQELSQDGNVRVTKAHVSQFLSNIHKDVDVGESPVPNLDQKDYTYDDIALLGISGTPFMVDTQIGQTLVVGDGEYFCIANPYKVTEDNMIPEQSLKTKITILNSDLLLNSGRAEDDIIYLCLVSNVLAELNDDKLNDKLNEYIIKMYYPSLFNAGIKGIRELTDQMRQKLIAPSIKIGTSGFEKVDMFYDINKYSSDFPLKYAQQGIKDIKITLVPDFNTFLPLDVIFKLLHANKENPLIKQSFSSRRENVYRIYTDRVTTTGVKVPYLNISSINTISKTVSKVASVAVYIEYAIMRTIQSFVCAFEETGAISIYARFDDAHMVSIQEFDELVKTNVNPVIQLVKTNFEQNGISVNLYKTIWDKKVTLVKMTYKSVINDVYKFNIEDKIGCISHVFNIESPTTMRFKRVSNFNKLTSLEAFIIEKVNQESSSKEIVESLVQNFNISEKEANTEFSSFMSAQQISVNVKKFNGKIKVNPGFFTSVEQKQRSVSIEITGINNIYYMNTIPIYIDSLVRITQPNISTHYPLARINMLCSVTETLAPAEISSKNSSETSSSDALSGISLEEGFKEMNIIDVPKKEITDKLIGLEEDDSEVLQEEDVSQEDEGPVLQEEDVSQEDEEPVSDKDVVSEEDVVLEPLKEIIIPKAIVKKKVFGMDSSGEEDDEEEDDEEEEETKGGAKVKTIEKVKTTENRDAPSSFQPKSLDISSLKLKNDNPFPQDRIKDRDPVLFESMENSMNSKFKFSKTQNNFTAYSTMCASNIKRQPVILTKDELIELKKTPGLLTGSWKGDKYVGNDVLEYGADVNNKNYYMCPRYWCLPTDKMMTHEQVIAGECGGVDKIIPKGASTPGTNTIYQFYDPSEHGPADEKGQPKNYQQHYPSFLSKNKTNDGYCLPCCFKNFNTPSHNAIKAECLGKMGKDKMGKDEKVASAVKPTKKTEHGDYIKGPEKFPLEFARWGYLPLPIQQFFEEANINTNCQVSATDTSLKKFTPCLLRRGVERSATQSFIGCLASMSQRFNVKPVAPVRTIREFKNDIINVLTLDKFVRYQNGNLVIKFAKRGNGDNPVRANDPKYNDPAVPLLYLNYDGSELVRKATTPASIKFLNKAVTSFLNFKAFLNNDEILIDYTYLWDFVCDKNVELFPQFLHGMNLVILNIVDNDITNNVELICPTNQRSNTTFNTHKNTLMLMCKEGMYEPIYSLEDNDRSNFEIMTTFSSKNTHVIKPLRTLFDTLLTPMFAKCAPLPSIPQSKYNIEDVPIKRAIYLPILISRLSDLKYTVLHQVMNYQGKVIGVVAKHDDTPEGRGYIPCYPSSAYEDGYTYKQTQPIDYIFMDDHDKIWNTYENTVHFLQKVANTKNVHHHNLKKMKIPCAPILRVIDSGVVVGLLTETNQFIQISDPFIRAISMNDTYNLKDIDENGYLVGEPYSDDNKTVVSKGRQNADEYIIGNSNGPDISRIEYIKRIKLEENFYNVFKNSVRILITRPEHIDVKEEISRIVRAKTMMYQVKMEQVIKSLIKLTKSKIQFVDFGENSFETVRDIIQTNNINVETGDAFEQEIRKIGECITLPDCAKASFPAFCKLRKTKTVKKLGCALLLPTVSMITNAVGNEARYFEKMADELIRYSRMSAIFLSPQSYLGVSLSGHNLSADEILILESSIKDYFKFLALSSTKIAQNRQTFVYDDAVPNHNEFFYTNDDKTEDDLRDEMSGQICNTVKTNKLSAKTWNECFRNEQKDTFGEIIFEENVFCTFQIVLHILNSFRVKKGYNDPNDIKTLLLNEYRSHIDSHVTIAKKEKRAGTEDYLRVRDEFIQKIVSILVAQGKKTRGDQVKSKDMSFISFIEYPDYYLTVLDLWILFEYFKIPCIFLSKSCLIESGAKQLVGFSRTDEGSVDLNEKFVFIIVSSSVIPQYKIVTHNDAIAISLNDFANGVRKDKIVDAIKNKSNVTEFIDGFNLSTHLNMCKK